MSAPPAPRSILLERATLFVSALVPATFAAIHAANVADAAHDDGVIRVAGLGATGAWRALDAAAAACVIAMPLGTRAFRAALAGALVTAIAAMLVHRIARVLLAVCADVPRLGALLASVAASCASLSFAWQSEGASAGGTMLGAALILAPLAIVVDVDRVAIERVPLVGLLVGLASSYEPLAGVAAIVAIASHAWSSRKAYADAWRSSRAPFAAAGVGLIFGVTPLVLAFVRPRVTTSIAYGARPFAQWLGERGAATSLHPLRAFADDFGLIALSLAGCGVVIALFVARARPLGTAIFALLAVTLVTIVFGAPAGPARYASPVLAAIAAGSIFVAVAMQSIARAIAAARIPFAQASASMILLLEFVLPVRIADDTSARLDARPQETAAIWNDVAIGPMPANALVLVADLRVMKRVAAARADGSMRADLDVVPTFDLGSRTALRELAREPRLNRYWLDAVLAAPPEEWSLASIAAKRPLVVTFDPRWEHALARHLVPTGLAFVFEPEPRGGSERKKAIDDLAPDLARLLTPIAPRPRAPALPASKDVPTPLDPELASSTTALLRGRAIAFAASNDRDLALRAIDDLRKLSPNDEFADRLTARIASSKGAIDVHEFVP